MADVDDAAWPSRVQAQRADRFELTRRTHSDGGVYTITLNSRVGSLSAVWGNAPQVLIPPPWPSDRTVVVRVRCHSSLEKEMDSVQEVEDAFLAWAAARAWTLAVSRVWTLRDGPTDVTLVFERA